jgi:hypothetical protein
MTVMPLRCMVWLLVLLASPATAADATMRAMAGEVAELLPLVIIDRAFDRPGAPTRAAAAARRVAKQAHRLERGFSKVGDDPILGVMAGRLAQRLERGAALLEGGAHALGRAQVRSAVAHCIACHTRTAGPSRPSLLSQADLEQMSSVERGDLLAATRDFSRASAQYEAALLTEVTGQAWEATARKLLAIVVRVRQDPGETSRRLAALRGAPALPAKLGRALALWEEAVRAWKKGDTPEKLYDDGTEAIRRGGAAASFIHDLRASAAIHERLRDDPTGEDLRLAGLISERLAKLDFWGIAEAYYEACVRAAPGTWVAKDCYWRYERMQPYADVLNHGVSVRAEVEQDLVDELAELAGLPSE